ncbi:unnamed protein product [Schistosoma mattheei]|uniref:Uncharacterized protein n=1 Tax=Schistosoma mattheei TaxID=31246 RepID=A0A3P7ZDF9_9TREM|nr:unnamed protein product [Schistosoma mattheei]
MNLFIHLVIIQILLSVYPPIVHIMHPFKAKKSV